MGRAFSLIELLIATVVLATGILGVLALFPTLITRSARVEASLIAAREARRVLDALRQVAREHTHTLGAAGGVEGVFLLLPHLDAAAARARPDPLSDAVFGDPRCLVLPFGSDKVFTYPRAGSGAALAAANGRGRARFASESLAAEALYLLPARADELSTSELGFALRIQRAQVNGVPRDGLYQVTILVYSGLREELLRANADLELVAHFTCELAAGPGEGAARHARLPPAYGEELAPGESPQDWQSHALRALSARERLPISEEAR